MTTSRDDGNTPPPAGRGVIVDATRDNFAALVLDNSEKGPVLLYCWQPNAGPCMRQYPLLEQLAHEHGGRFLLVNLNTQAQGALARELGVNSVPTLRLYRQREVRVTRHGFQNLEDLRQLLQAWLPRRSDTAIAHALALHAQGQADAALQALAVAAVDDPANSRVPLTLARLLMREGRPCEAQRLLDSLPPELADAAISRLRAHLAIICGAQQAPDEAVLRARLAADGTDAEAAHALAARRLLADDYDAAISGWLALLQARPEHAAARAALLAVLDLLGPEDARTRRVRAALLH